MEQQLKISPWHFSSKQLIHPTSRLVFEVRDARFPQSGNGVVVCEADELAFKMPST